MKQKKGKDPDETETDESVPEKAVRKPRIRIKMKAPVNTTSDDGKAKKAAGSKRKRSTDSADNDLLEHNSDYEMMEPIPKKTKKKDNKSSKPPQRKEKEATIVGDQQRRKSDAAKKSKESSMFNLALWKKAKQNLDGSFIAARDYLTRVGPWVLPSNLSDDKFADVAKEMLGKMKKIDKFNVFAEPVTEDDAPGYFEIIESPMDFATMRKKVISGEYGSGSDAASKFYDDMILIFDNCLLYNDEGGEIADEAIRIMLLVPEAYVSVCLSVGKKGK